MGNDREVRRGAGGWGIGGRCSQRATRVPPEDFAFWAKSPRGQLQSRKGKCSTPWRSHMLINTVTKVTVRILIKYGKCLYALVWIAKEDIGELGHDL